MTPPGTPDQEEQWFVMRDYSQDHDDFSFRHFERDGFRVFTPMRWKLAGHKNNRKRVYAPLLRDLFFVYSTRELLDKAVEQHPNVTYRFLKGFYHKPMVVRNDDMERFMYAVEHSKKVEYFTLSEIDEQMCGSRVTVIGGTLDGYEGRIIELRYGQKTVKRLLLELPGLFAVGVSVAPRYIRVLDGAGDGSDV